MPVNVGRDVVVYVFTCTCECGSALSSGRDGSDGEDLDLRWETPPEGTGLGSVREVFFLSP